MLGGYQIIFGEWQIQTNILSLLPNDGYSQNKILAEQALFEDKNNQIIIAISGNKSKEAYHALQKQVLALPLMSLATLEAPSISDVSTFYKPYVTNVMSKRYLSSIESSAEITQLISTQLTQLTNPFVSETIAYAPRLNLAEMLNFELNRLNDFEKSQGVVSVNYQNKTYYLASFLVVGDSFSLHQSQSISSQLKQVFTDVIDKFGVELTYSGILFHTAESSLQAESEISTFGLLSLLGVIALIYYVFRTILPLMVALGVITLASFYGFTAVLFIFKELHLLTLVFAVTIIGVVIDYCFHSFVYIKDAKSLQHKRINNLHAGESFISSKVLKPLVIGFVTTALGYFALMFSPLVLLSQMAVFMVFGLLGALLSVTLFLPQNKYIQTIQIMPSILNTSNAIKRTIVKVQSKRNLVFIISTCLIVVGITVEKLEFNDDIRLLNSSPKWLMNNESTMANVLGYQNSQRVIVRAASIELLLQRQEQVISTIISNQKSVNIKSIAGLLPSISQQRYNHDLLQTADAKGVFEPGLNMTGLTSDISKFNPMTYDEFSRSALKPVARLFTSTYVVKDDSGKLIAEYALWFEITKNKLNQVNLNWLEAQTDVSIFDKAKDVTNTLTDYREGVQFLIVIAFIIAALILMSRYHLRNGMLSFLTICYSAIGALLLSQLVLGNLNIFNLLAVLLTLALAIDYLVFYQEHGLKQRTLIAISLSAISSALVFGVLAFSLTPAVQSFGVTVMFGIVLIFVFAPLTANSSLSTENYDEFIDEKK